MDSGIFVDIAFGPVNVIFAVVFSGVLAFLAYLLLRDRDENMAFWTAPVVFCVALVLGILWGGYVPCFLAAVSVLVLFAPKISSRSGIAIVVILAVVVVSYVGIPFYNSNEGRDVKSTLIDDFAYDDKDLLTNNDFLAGWMSGAVNLQEKKVHYWKEVFSKDFAQLAQKAAGAPSLNAINYYRPVIACSYMLDYYFWSEVPKWEVFSRDKDRSELKYTVLNPFGFHLTNVLYHGLNALLVFLLVRSMTRRYWVALSAGVLFAVHPIHTESVTWIAGRTDVIGTTFFLAAFCLYIRFRNCDQMRYFFAALVLFLFAAFAKEMTATLVPVLIAYEVIRFWAARAGAGDLYLPVGQKMKSRTGMDLLIHCLYPLAFLLVVLLYFVVKALVIDPGQPLPPEASPWFDISTGRMFAFGKIFLTFMEAVFWYLKKSFYPVPLDIYPSIDWTATGKGFLFMLLHLLIVAAGVVGLLLWKRGRLVTFSIVAFYVSLLPLSCLVEGTRLLRFSEDIDFPISERFLYIPSLFACLVVAWLLGYLTLRLLPRGGKVLAGVLLAAIALVSTVAIQERTLDWQDDYHLFRSGIRTSPKSVRMANNFGFELMQNWEIKRARKQLFRCTNLVRLVHKGRAPMPIAFQNLGHSYYLQGDFVKAVEYYRKSYLHDPRNAVMANNLGALMGIFGSITMNHDMIREGLGYYQRAVELAPQYVFANASVKFMRNVWLTWDRYMNKKIRHPLVVLSFGNSFLYSSRSISESDDPKYLQAMQILSSGLTNMPSDEEMVKIFGAAPKESAGPDGGESPRQEDDESGRYIKVKMIELFDKCFARGIRKYEELLDKKRREDPEKGVLNPALNFMLGEVYRVGWHRTRKEEHLERARKHFEITLSREPEHAGASRGMVEVLRASGRIDEAEQVATRAVDTLLVPEIPWEESIPEPIPVPRTREALELAKIIVSQALSDLAGKETSGANLTSKRWKAFLDATVGKCLDVQLERAKTHLGGKDAESWNNVGYFHVLAFDVFRETKMLETALEHFDYALRLEPHRPGPTLNKIHVLKMLGRGGEAEQLRALMHQRYPRDPRFVPKEVPKGAVQQPGQMPLPPGLKPMPQRRQGNPRR